MRLNLKHLDRHGDTIVEVLLVLAILGFAISISYATATRSLTDARRAQESAEANALLQAQVEALRSMVNYDTTDPENIFNQPGNTFCVNDAALPYTAEPLANAACLKKNLYQLSITYNASGPNEFTLLATWPDVQGQGNDTTTITYRLYPPAP